MLYNLSKALVAAVVIPLALGCKREPMPQQAATPATAGTTISQKLQQWLKNQPLSISVQGRNSTGNNLPKHTIVWGQTRQHQGQYTTPLALAHEGRTASNVQAALTATEDARGQISGGQYVIVLPDTKAMGQAATERDWATQLAQPDNSMTEFTGVALYYNMAGALTASKVYKNGQLLPNAKALLTAKGQKARPKQLGASKNTASNNRPPSPCGTELVCIEWFLQTFVDGVLVSEVYLYTTCECPGDGSGGGSSGDTDAGCEAAAAAFAAAGSVTNIHMPESNGIQTATEWRKSYKWKIYDALTWRLYSFEDGVLEKKHYANNTILWEFKSFTHNRIDEEGGNIGGIRTWTDNGATINMTPFSAWITLKFSVKHHIICQNPLFQPWTDQHATSTVFRAPNTIAYVNNPREAGGK
jgi:phage tail protein X